jgi:hypothetical protein
MFSYGHVTWPKEDDPTFEEESEAVAAAAKASEDYATSPVFGVWDDETGELLHIVYEGWVYSGK